MFDTFFPGYQLDLYKDELQDPIQGIKTIVREVTRFRMEDPEMGIIIQQEFYGKPQDNNHTATYHARMENIGQPTAKGEKRGVEDARANS